MSCVIYNDSECHTPKLSTFLAFYPSARRQFARAPVLPERQFCHGASFARAQIIYKIILIINNYTNYVLRYL